MMQVTDLSSIVHDDDDDDDDDDVHFLCSLFVSFFDAM